EILSALLVLPVRRGRAAYHVPCLRRILQKMVDDYRRNRVLYRLQADLEIGADVEKLVEQEWLRIGAPRSMRRRARHRMCALRFHDGRGCFGAFSRRRRDRSRREVSPR